MAKDRAVKVDRRAKQRQIAESRASHFARAAPSSTPTGIVFKANDANSSANRWPGPFATAREIMSQRDEARQQLEDSRKNKESGNVADEDEEFDEYDKTLQTLLSESASASSSSQANGVRRTIFPITSLSDACISVLVSKADFLRNLDNVTQDTRDKIIGEWMKKASITQPVANAFVVEGSQMLCLPECSNLSEEFIMTAIERVSVDPNASAEGEFIMPIDDDDGGKNDNAAIDANVFKHGSVRVIQLKNAGHGFTDRVAAALINRAHELEILEVQGCYKMTDEALSRLLGACASSLRYLDMTTNSRIHTKSLDALDFNVLTSLSLDYAVHLSDEDLYSLVSSSNADEAKKLKSNKAKATALPALENLSLAGLINMTDNGLQPLLCKFGRSLQGLCVEGCAQLTDESIICIRTECSRLKSLNISNLSDISTTALLGLFVLHPDLQQGSSGSGDDGDDDDDGDDEEEGNDDEKNDPDIPAWWGQSSADRAIKSHSLGPLEDVLLKGLGGVTDDVVVHLALAGRNTLQFLSLNSCKEVSGKAAVAVAANCGATLERLDISFCRKIPEAAVTHLTEWCPGMKQVWLWGCTQLTKTFFAGLRPEVDVVGRLA